MVSQQHRCPLSTLGYLALQSNSVPAGVRNAYAAGLRAPLDWEPATDKHGEEHHCSVHCGDCIYNDFG